MAVLLHIETSTTMCSVALSENDRLLAFKEINEGYTHAENLHVFIHDLLNETKLQTKDLNAIAVSKGPGSYTGLRIGVSTAKGLAYALKLPLISVDTLQVMALQAKIRLTEPAFFCPMLDARRMEVYTAVYDSELNRVNAIQALIVDEHSIVPFSQFPNLHFFGDGMGKCKALLSQLKNAGFIENIVPSAKDMIALAYAKFQNKDFEDVAYFEPFYLKDFLILKK
jgi:tRNA threonylcarbamoyladenosine biosynthesis protein TsaB